MISKNVGTANSDVPMKTIRIGRRQRPKIQIIETSSCPKFCAEERISPAALVAELTSPFPGRRREVRRSWPPKCVGRPPQCERQFPLARVSRPQWQFPKRGRPNGCTALAVSIGTTRKSAMPHLRRTGGDRMPGARIRPFSYLATVAESIRYGRAARMLQSFSAARQDISRRQQSI
jgi:hypothetical protein